MRMFVIILVLLCLGISASWSEPLDNPVTGEPGYWLSMSDMQQTVIVMEERDYYYTQYEQLSVKYVTLEKSQRIFKTIMIVEAVAILLGGTALWLLK